MRISTIRQLKKLDGYSIAQMSNAEHLLLLKSWRWPKRNPLNMNDAECPHCGCHCVTYYANQGRWKCKECRKMFSLTSGTAFSYHKLPLGKILLFLFHIAASAATVSSVELGKLLGITQKSAYLLKMRTCEVLMQTWDFSQLSGNVQIDGCYKTQALRFSSFLPKAEFQQQRAKKKADKRCIIVAREKQGKTFRTLFFTVFDESAEQILPFAQRFIQPNSKVWTDGHLSYKSLKYQYQHDSVNHKKEYKSKKGVHNNACESLNSRFRHIQKEAHHISTHRLLYYVAETAYKADNNKLKPWELLRDLVQRFFSLKPLRDWMNYTRGNIPRKELLGLDLFDVFEAKQQKNYLPIATQ